MPYNNNDNHQYYNQNQNPNQNQASGLDYYRYPNSTPNPQYSQYTGYRTNTPPPPDPGKARAEKERKAGKVIGYVASLLVVGVLSGAAGGGIVYNNLTSKSVAANASLFPAETSATSPEASAPPSSSPPASTDDSPIKRNKIGGSIADVVEKVSGSVVEISVEVKVMNPFYGEQSGGGSGSGVIISQDGYIATNNHVIDGASSITVCTKDGTEYPAVLVGTDDKTDLAVVKIEATGLTPVTLGDSDQLQVGETAIAIGNPLGTLGGTVTSGIISAKNREITIDNQTMSLIQTSAAVNPGNSGGGLFNEYGELIGIVNAKSSSGGYGSASVEGLGFAIPSNMVRTVSDDIIEHGYVTGRPELGIQIIVVSDPQTAFSYRVNELGVYIAVVTKENGLQSGDLIVSIDGSPVEGIADIRAVVEGKSIGDTVEFVVKRDGRQTNVTVTLTENVPAYILERNKGDGF